MFDGFSLEMIDTGEATLRVRHGGSGPPLLLLHGHPQTHAMWHRVAPPLARDFSLVIPDLRGYGESSKPPTTPDHEPYSKRAMARDMIALMQHFGHQRFAVAGHDRGGRVAYRMALDHPERVARMAVLDITQTGEVFRGPTWSSAWGTGTGSSWHSRMICPSVCSGPTPTPTTSATAICRGWTRRRSPTTCAARGGRRRSTPCARTTGRAPRSTSSSTRPIVAGAASPVRC